MQRAKRVEAGGREVTKRRTGGGRRLWGVCEAMWWEGVRVEEWRDKEEGE